MPQCAIVYMCEIKWLIRFDAWHHTSYCRQPRRLCRCSHFAKYVLEWESLENATWHKTLDRWGNNVLHRKYVQSRQNGCISVTTLSHSVIRFVSCLHSLFICQKWDRTIWLDQINQPKKDQMFYNIYYNLKDHHTPTGSGFPSPRNPWTAPTPRSLPLRTGTSTTETTTTITSITTTSTSASVPSEWKNGEFSDPTTRGIVLGRYCRFFWST